MEPLLLPAVKSDLSEMVRVAIQDKHAELELKVLGGQIQTKDVADRIVQAIESVTTGGFTTTNRATFAYPDGLRVSVTGVENVFKLATTASFRGLPLEVERKRRYFDAGGAGKDVIDIPDLKLRATLRHEEPLRKDFSGSPLDPASHMRIMNRKSWTTTDKLFRIDMSLVKSKQKQHKTFAEILDQTPSYELEVELLDKTASIKDLLTSLYRTVEPILAAFQQSAFLLTQSDLERYRLEFDAMRLRFVNPVTMERRHRRRRSSVQHPVRLYSDQQGRWRAVLLGRLARSSSPSVDTRWQDRLDGTHGHDRCAYGRRGRRRVPRRSQPVLHLRRLQLPRQEHAASSAHDDRQ
jgi:hypothetical protein